ncbi:hypothetical protein [Marilutibacter alkalisoli]|uniref:Uncharacterized protein n=1 Tax=Marilutibacter alkalisoli TaxID=2591633 RepID=A0A514BV13_9GAMM|nr:hypothetical protein [Lysobacter alkalisoli]QDH70869.1 hypothetical protein FKV23_12825 [Lysobacter alkalisoli]
MRTDRDIRDSELERQYIAGLATLPVPMTPACTRALTRTSAREHIYAEAHRKSGAGKGQTPRSPRRCRLTRMALRAEANAADLRREVR